PRSRGRRQGRAYRRGRAARGNRPGQAELHRPVPGALSAAHGAAPEEARVTFPQLFSGTMTLSSRLGPTPSDISGSRRADVPHAYAVSTVDDDGTRHGRERDDLSAHVAHGDRPVLARRISADAGGKGEGGPAHRPACDVAARRRLGPPGPL